MSVSDLALKGLSLRQRCAEVVEQALRAGATDAEAVAYEGDEFSALVRLGQVETLKESGSRAIGLRVFNGLRSASTSSSDLSREGLEKLAEYQVPTTRELEDMEIKKTAVWRFPA